MKHLKKNYVTVINIVVTLLLVIATIYVVRLHKLTSEKQDDVMKVTIDVKDLKDKYTFEIRSLKAGISQDNQRRYKILNISEIILETNSKLSKETAYLYSEYIVNSVELYGENSVPIYIITSLVSQESRFRYDAVSPAGAVGLGQMMEETANWICTKWNLPYYDSIRYDPKINIKMTVWYINWLYLNVYNRDIIKTLAHYNGGGWQAYRWGLIQKSKAGLVLSEEENLQMSKVPMENTMYVLEILERAEKHNTYMEK